MNARLFAIVDFESTCGDDGWNHNNRMEIIEFACSVTDKNFNVIGEFDEFVQPICFPVLTEYCTNLTTIKQSMIDDADTFDKVLYRFKDFLSHLSDDNDDILFCSWGNFDKNQLLKDCDLHNVRYPFNDHHCNLKSLVASKIKMSQNMASMNVVLDKLSLTLDGIHHRGIDDVRNIIKICRKAQLRMGDMMRAQGALV